MLLYSVVCQRFSLHAAQSATGMQARELAIADGLVLRDAFIHGLGSGLGTLGTGSWFRWFRAFRLTDIAVAGAQPDTEEKVMTVIKMATWSERKVVGDALERRVKHELESRGWTAAPYGQALLPEPIVRALQCTESKMRWDPDIVASQGSTICLIDAKAAMRGDEARTYTVSRKALRAHMRMWVDLDLPIYYVFSNLGVATPAEVMQFCNLARLGDAGGYVSFGCGLPRPFDEVFGTPAMPSIAMAA